MDVDQSVRQKYRNLAREIWPTTLVGLDLWPVATLWLCMARASLLWPECTISNLHNYL